MLVVTTLSFAGSELFVRLLLVSTVGAVFVTLAMLRGRSFFNLRWSGSTALLFVAAAFATLGVTDRIDASVANLFFFGLLPITALAGGVWSTVQFFRQHTLQFAAELICCFALTGFVFFVGSRL
jgi:hypothetical protein